jgi:hypothetical protein
MRLMRSLTVLGATGALILGLAGPASAARATGFDVRGDARAGLDITKVKFTHTSRGAFAKVFVRNLRPRGQFVFAVANRNNSVRFGLKATGRPGAVPAKRFYKYRNGHLSRKACHRAKAHWYPRRDIVTMWFPVRCYRALPRRVVMAVGSTVNFPSGRTVDQGPTVILRR